MEAGPERIFIGDTPLKHSDQPVRGEYVTWRGELFYMIGNVDAMEPFFMSVVSHSDHWLFVASNGGLTAGRVSPEQALFPYYSVDKITENSENTGPKSLFLVTRSGRTHLWEPFSERQRGMYAIVRNLYKNITGTTLVFEENNLDLGLTYRYAWRASERFGFVITSWLVNAGDSPCRVELLEGLQNILPANVATDTQQTFSALLDAYKRGELDDGTRLGIFALNSTLTDRAEPSESLLATTVAPLGLSQADCLLSSLQLDRFRSGKGVETETEVRGRRGAYFVHTTLDLGPEEEKTWHLMADVAQDSAAIVQRIRWLQGEPAGLLRELEADIAAGQRKLWKIVASADGVQLSASQLYCAFHFTNVLFNLMRGGTFIDNYWIEIRAFADFLAVRNLPVLQGNADLFRALPAKMPLADLQRRMWASGSPDLIRLSHTYLPLTFSRRHGDPSRPWNRFAIQIKNPDASARLDYEGNWRDIFQNWEALASSYPEFVENMIGTFLNATTADGYNPYRITYRGVDWEVPEPGHPWANLGYWSDHQIIYLQKLLEISDKVHPGKLRQFMTQAMFSYANVPYRIKPYADVVENPYNTIEYDWDADKQIAARGRERGTDGKLVYGRDGQVLQVSLAEKLLTLLLAKLANLVPEGGIWMNTQRPEWNDANNALVGKGLSVVTLGYLRRYLVFCRDLFGDSELAAVPLNVEVERFYLRVHAILRQFEPMLQASFDDAQRRSIMDLLGEAGSDYRWSLYRGGFSGERVDEPRGEIVAFLDLARQYVEHSLRANKRDDNLYHAYNTLHLEHGHAAISHLYPMLEGQVAILSSELLSGDESIALLEGLRDSALYKPEQNSYLLYPDRVVPGFLEKNCLTEDQVRGIRLLTTLVEAGDPSIITRDVNGVYHFSSHIRNWNDVRRRLEELKTEARYAELVAAEFDKIRTLFEQTFHHDEFTGRSGTFFAYEGLGSVYWHMVAKLLLAVQETILRVRGSDSVPALVRKYTEIREGLSFSKSPEVYGAFPSDPYSHTPAGQGAKQPGMTGQVKEVILTRLAEVGLTVAGGCLVFDPLLVDPGEFLTAPSVSSYLDVTGREQTLELKAGSLAYSICQTPIVLEANAQKGITIHCADGTLERLQGQILDAVNSRHVFERDGAIHHLAVSLPIGQDPISARMASFNGP